MDYLFSSSDNDTNGTKDYCSDWYYQNCSTVAQTSVTGPCDVCDSTCATTCWSDCSYTCVAGGKGICTLCNALAIIL